MAQGTISVNRFLLLTFRVPGLRGHVVGALMGVALPTEGRYRRAMSPGRNRALVSRRDASRPRGSFRFWGGTDAGASHWGARLPGRHGRPARLEPQQYSPQGSPRSDTGSGRGGGRQVRHRPASRGPRVSFPSLGLQRLPALPSRAASPDRAPFVGRAPSPKPAASVSPAPSASGPSVRCLAARRVQPPPSRFGGPSLSARPPPTGPPRSRSTSRNCPGACWASRLKARAGLHAPDLPAPFSPDSRHSLRRVLPQGPGPVTYGWL